MSRLRIVLAAMFAVGVLAVLAVPASASVPAANAKFCKAADNIGDSSSSQPAQQVAGHEGQASFKNAAKYAPAKVKSAMNDIAKYLGLVAGCRQRRRPGEGVHEHRLQELLEVDHHVRHVLRRAVRYRLTPG